MRNTLYLGGLLARFVIAEWPNTLVREGYREDYVSWGALFGPGDDQFSGYKWTPYIVTTEDGWELTMFKV